MPSLPTAYRHARSGALRFSLAAIAILVANVALAWQDRARTRDALAMLEAQMLQDIGVTPRDIFQAIDDAY